MRTSWVRLYAPFLVLALVQGLFIAVAPSRGGGMPLGVLPQQDWDAVEVELAPGDVFVVVSDGVLDLLGDPLAGLEQIAGLLRGVRSADEVVQRVEALAAGDDLGDDVTVQVVRRREDG